MNQDQGIIMKCPENQKNEYYMQKAYLEALKAYKKGEVPVGAVVVYRDKIIARAHNLREKKQEFHAHAEFLAMQKAAKKLKSWRLDECDVYVTLEPCQMCAGAMIQSRIRSLYFGALDPKAGVIKSVYNLFSYPFNHKVSVCDGILEEQSEKLLKDFFKKIRKK